jgi:hypothetical protein
MKERISDTRKVIAISMWIATRAAVVACAYALLKLGSVAVKLV